MDNNRWDNMIQESFKYPEELSGVEARFKSRIMKEKRKKRTVVSSLSAIAASILFIILINTNIAFANAVAELPVIGKLAEYVKLDKSLSKAIENEYVQEINLVAWDGSNRLFLPYVIADEKKLILFFHMPDEFKRQSNQWVNIFLKNMKNSETGEKVDGYGYSTSGLSPDEKNNYGFIMQDYHFEEDKLPKSLDIEVEVKIENMLGSYEAHISETPYNKTNSTIETIGTYSFHIELEDFAEPIIYEINETHTIFGQKIIVKNMKVYPTGTEVNFSFPVDNSGIIKGLELEVLQDDYKLLKGNGNGFSATYDIENNKMSVYIESNYFDKPKKQELLINGVRLLNKNEEYITVDIDNKTITPNIEGMILKQVIKKSGYATLVFSTEILDDDNFGMFSSEYKDAAGNAYRLDGEGTSSYNSQMETLITVKYPEDGKVILRRTLTPKILLDKPIRINLPVSN
ncbi:DUF4179 domain-containing protein [Sedimentibacter sp.]|uniref:DUF4179 domain-containing protein n=1 Tax=Sedimentibacter sp. TaxID=1960295 RepID=UPI0028AD509C|nr:DUF4179 domain-containing protein [Sedimentibacter sp.]